MGPIQIIPPGLMGLLQLKQEGRLPGTLSETVVPVIEMRDWYLTARRVDTVGLFGAALQTAAALVTGNNGVRQLTIGATGAPAQVPTGQIWFVEQFVIQANTAAAADVISFLPMLLSEQNLSHAVGAPYIDTVTARNRSCFAKADRGFWAYPGDIFAMGVIDIATAGITPGANLRATSCQV